jgi:hypothetical protein
MIPQINILLAVDVIGALSAGSLANALRMMDNHPANCRPIPPPLLAGGRPSQGVASEGLGTAALTTTASYAQVLNWHAVGIDFQTEAQITGIRFFRNGQPVTAKDTPCARLGRYGAPSGDYWAGVVNAPEAIEPGVYRYKIDFLLNGRPMSMDRFATLIVAR